MFELVGNSLCQNVTRCAHELSRDSNPAPFMFLLAGPTSSFQTLIAMLVMTVPSVQFEKKMLIYDPTDPESLILKELSIFIHKQETWKVDILDPDMDPNMVQIHNFFFLIALLEFLDPPINIITRNTKETQFLRVSLEFVENSFCETWCNIRKWKMVTRNAHTPIPTGDYN